VSRARRGAGVEGGVNTDIPTKTAYFAKPYFHPYGDTWGAPFGGDCHGNGNGNGNGNGPGGTPSGGGGGQTTPAPPVCHGKHCKPRCKARRARSRG
jgi:hypothetical protein